MKLKKAMEVSGVEPFHMVAACSTEGGHLSPAQETLMVPAKRHPSHRAATYAAHQMAKLHGRPFVVLSVSGLALPGQQRG